MTHAFHTATLPLVALLAVGCAMPERTLDAEQEPAIGAAAQLERVKVETKQAAQATQDYAYAQRAEFVDKMKTDLIELQKELELLTAKVDDSSGAAKADAKVKLVAVREKMAQAKTRLDSAESATESNWEDVKAGYKQAYVELKDSFEHARQWLSDKIEP